jgi:type VI secretion system protein VasI
MTGNASAQSVPDKDIATCAAISSVVERLSCFDDLAKSHKLTATTENTSSPGKGKWFTQTDKDPMNDKAIYGAALTADSGKGRFGDSIALIVRCKNNKTEMFIDWSSYLGLDRARTTYRIDKQKAITSNWSISTNHKAAFFPGSPVSTLKKIAESTSFVASVTPYGENPVTAVFDTTGAAEALADIRKGCKW